MDGVTDSTIRESLIYLRGARITYILQNKNLDRNTHFQDMLRVKPRDDNGRTLRITKKLLSES